MIPLHEYGAAFIRTGTEAERCRKLRIFIFYFIITAPREQTSRINRLFDMLGEIEAIQIRLDRPYKSKFNNLTSVDKYYGTTASCCPHFAGPHDSDAVYLTEGVMKADIAQYLSNALGQPRCFIGLTGVGNINQFRRLLKELATVHINRIIVAFDMDALINENVRNARQRVLQEGSDAGFEMTPIAWDEKYKGIDDLLLSFKEARAS